MNPDRPTLCGDCHSPLATQPAGSEASRGSDPDSYCPRCRRSAVKSVTCRRCGSTVCEACGSIIESASDLGFG